MSKIKIALSHPEALQRFRELVELMALLLIRLKMIKRDLFLCSFEKNLL